MRWLLLLGLLVAGCEVIVDGELPGLSDDDDSAAVEPGDAPTGFVGSPCLDVSDCDFDTAVCLPDDDGYPGGLCTQACDLYCPDRDAHPMTFCAAADALPPEAAELGDGACLSRCDFAVFPQAGCRQGYGCVVAGRANEPGTETYVCMPQADSELGACHAELIARGIAFEPTVVHDTSPSDHPELTCHVEDPVRVLSPVFGVELLDNDGNPTPRVLAACEMAHSLADTVLDVKERGVVGVRQMGTYNCRVIAGTSTLSRHGMGDAIDLSGFDFSDGSSFSVYDDWEHDTSAPVTEAGIFLYEAAYRWFDEEYWNIILTPNYNAAHDNHFHVDLTPGSDYIGFFGGRYVGPAPYAD